MKTDTVSETSCFSCNYLESGRWICPKAQQCCRDITTAKLVRLIKINFSPRCRQNHHGGSAKLSSGNNITALQRHVLDTLRGGDFFENLNKNNKFIIIEKAPGLC
jgi:hypothetical protein